MATARKLVLQNRLGQGIRVLQVNGDRLNLIYRQDSRRVEAHSDLSGLDRRKVRYTILSQLNSSAIPAEGFALPNGLGRLANFDETTKITHNEFELPEENDQKRTAAVMKKVTAAHVAAVMGVIGLSFFFKPIPKEEPQLVTIVLPKEEKQQATVKPATQPVQKITRQTVTARKPVTKPVSHTVVHRKPVNPRNVKVARIVHTEKPRSLDNVGALAAMGGLRNGTRGAQGLDLNSMKNIRSAGVGTGGGGVGLAGSGGVSGVMPGTGLIAGSSGRGARGESAGGYGTRGQGGGRAGYGTISMVGGAGGVSLPPDEDVGVQGGLTIDQIMAVINKNMGQIIYCYEQGLIGQPSLKGRVNVSFTINAAGRVQVSRVEHSSLGSKAVEGCMISRLNTWQFPRPVGGVKVDVTEYPFNLTRMAAR